jgi:hypothetical protein
MVVERMGAMETTLYPYHERTMAAMNFVDVEYE